MNLKFDKLLGKIREDDTPPIATTSTLGSVKVDGTSVSIADGVISASVKASKLVYSSTPTATIGTVGIPCMFNSNGTVLYAITGESSLCSQIPLSTAYDISTKGTISTFQDTDVTDRVAHFTISNNGTKLYILYSGTQIQVRQYSLSTAWDVTTATYDSKTCNVSELSAELSADKISIINGGTTLLVTIPFGGRVEEYTMSAAYDISTATLTKSYNLPINSANVLSGFSFSDSGEYLYTTDVSTSGAVVSIKKHYLSAAYSISSIIETYELSNVEILYVIVNNNVLYGMSMLDGYIYQYNPTREYTNGAIRQHYDSEIYLDTSTSTNIISIAKSIYVTTTGSDNTGDGSENNPYATLGKALSTLDGKILKAPVTILLADGTYGSSSNPILLALNIDGINNLNIQGNQTNPENCILLNYTLIINGNEGYPKTSLEVAFLEPQLFNITGVSFTDCSDIYNYTSGYFYYCVLNNSWIVNKHSNRIILKNCTINGTLSVPLTTGIDNVNVRYCIISSCTFNYCTTAIQGLDNSFIKSLGNTFNNCTTSYSPDLNTIGNSMSYIAG